MTYEEARQYIIDARYTDKPLDETKWDEAMDAATEALRKLSASAVLTGDAVREFAISIMNMTVDLALEVIDKDLNDYIDFACKNAPDKYEESARVLLAGALTISKAAALKLKGRVEL